MRLSSSFVHELTSCQAPRERKLHASSDWPLSVSSTAVQHPKAPSEAAGPTLPRFGNVSSQLSTRAGAGLYGPRVRAGSAPRSAPPPPGQVRGQTRQPAAGASGRTLLPTRDRGAPVCRPAPGWPPNSRTRWRGSAPPATRASATASSPRPPRSTAARCGRCRRKVRPWPRLPPAPLLVPTPAAQTSPAPASRGLLAPAHWPPGPPTPILPLPRFGILLETSLALSFRL